MFEKAKVGASVEVENYLRKSVLSNSTNMIYDRICDLLKGFSEGWCQSFKSQFGSRDIDKANIKALVETRNKIAHGAPVTTPSIQTIKDYFFLDAVHFIIWTSVCHKSIELFDGWSSSERGFRIPLVRLIIENRFPKL